MANDSEIIESLRLVFHALNVVQKLALIGLKCFIGTEIASCIEASFYKNWSGCRQSDL